MRAETTDQNLQVIEHRADSGPSAIEFAMAYQARVAIDRIRFAIKHTEQFGSGSDQIREAGFQLLDALQRLEAVDRLFQEKSGTSTGAICAGKGCVIDGIRRHGTSSKPSSNADDLRACLEQDRE
jgi:hypothetical protein